MHNIECQKRSLFNFHSLFSGLGPQRNRLVNWRLHRAADVADLADIILGATQPKTIKTVTDSLAKSTLLQLSFS
jgi:hypothetical protein